MPGREPLIQLRYRRQPWRLLVACCLLNRTRGVAQVRPLLPRLFEIWPTPREMAAASEVLESVITPLGLQNRRAESLRRLSACYPGRRMTREEVLALPGCGDYAADAYEILVLGDLRVEPSDVELRRWLEWAREDPHTRAPWFTRAPVTGVQATVTVRAPRANQYIAPDAEFVRLDVDLADVVHPGDVVEVDFGRDPVGGAWPEHRIDLMEPSRSPRFPTGRVDPHEAAASQGLARNGAGPACRAIDEAGPRRMTNLEFGAAVVECMAHPPDAWQVEGVPDGHGQVSHTWEVRARWRHFGSRDLHCAYRFALELLEAAPRPSLVAADVARRIDREYEAETGSGQMASRNRVDRAPVDGWAW